MFALIALTTFLAQAIPVQQPRMLVHLAGTADRSRAFDVDATRRDCTPARARDARTVLALVKSAATLARPTATADVRILPAEGMAGAYRIQFHLPSPLPTKNGDWVEDGDGVLATIRAFASCAYVTTIRVPSPAANGLKFAGSGFYVVPERGIVYADVLDAPSHFFVVP
jgi:hypothetical protein